MKKLTLLLSTAIVMASFVTSCKKGDGDPGLSLRSRKARLVGEWKVTSYEDNSKTTSGGNVTENNTTLSNGTYKDVTKSGTNSYTEEGTGEYKITFEKDYTFKIVYTYTVSKVTFSDGTNTTSTTLNPVETTTITIEGSWSFAGKDKAGEYKNKERVLLNITKQTVVTPDYSMSGTLSTRTDTYTYANGESVMTLELNTLKNKILEIIGTYNSSYNSVDADGHTHSSSTTGNFKMTAEQ